jgi:hypothetical protein
MFTTFTIRHYLPVFPKQTTSLGRRSWEGPQPIPSIVNHQAELFAQIASAASIAPHYGLRVQQVCATESKCFGGSMNRAAQVLGYPQARSLIPQLFGVESEGPKNVTDLARFKVVGFTKAIEHIVGCARDLLHGPVVRRPVAEFVKRRCYHPLGVTSSLDLRLRILGGSISMTPDSSSESANSGIARARAMSFIRGESPFAASSDDPAWL